MRTNSALRSRSWISFRSRRRKEAGTFPKKSARLLPSSATNQPMLRLLINGAKGRMGQMLIGCAKEIPGLAIGAGVDVGDDFSAGLAESDAVIDFSHHSTCDTILAG